MVHRNHQVIFFQRKRSFTNCKEGDPTQKRASPDQERIAWDDGVFIFLVVLSLSSVLITCLSASKHACENGSQKSSSDFFSAQMLVHKFQGRGSRAKTFITRSRAIAWDDGVFIFLVVLSLSSVLITFLHASMRDGSQKSSSDFFFRALPPEPETT
jgi:hypothetical protein